MRVRIEPADRIGGTITVPGDKSLSHRALMFGALAHGEARVTNLAPGEDVRSTARVLSQLGVEIESHTQGEVRLMGRGFEGLRAPTEPLCCGNSGTTMRLMMGVVAGRPFRSELIGDASLNGRPMRRIADPLRAMGAEVTLSEGGRPPVVVNGRRLDGIVWDSTVASAQVKSAILLAGLQAAGTTVVTEPAKSRDHTERMLARMGAALEVRGNTVRLQPGALGTFGSMAVPGDVSSAAFLLAAGLLLKGRGLGVENVGTNPTRVGFLEAVAQMGALIEVLEAGELAGEPTATLQAQRSRLTGVVLRGAALVRAIDEVPILAVLMTQAHGRSVIADAAELRVKESDRLAATAAFLNAMGAQVEERPDGLVISGPTPLRGAEVDAHGDHRIAMAARIAALVADGPTTISGAESVAVSYPAFFDDLDALTGATKGANR